jgi:thiamine biosynthesis lipoprotein
MTNVKNEQIKLFTKKNSHNRAEFNFRFYICTLFRIKLNNDMKIVASLLAGLLLISSSPKIDKAPESKQRLYISHYENVLGTSLEFKITSISEQEVEKAESAALAEIERLSSIFSAYDTNSEFSKWMKQDLNKPVKVSKELFGMLNLFEQWKKRTNGALNASAAVAGKLWSDAAKNQQIPSTLALKNAVIAMQQENYKLDEANLTATRLTNTPLVMNTFAKSYIINLACDAALASSKINAVVVNIGGDLVIKGDVKDLVNVTNPQANAENDAPLAYLTVSNRAVATSGNYRRGEQIGKHWYSHIVDPRTAKPVEGVISATVIAPNATDAGALATAFNVLTIEESKALASTVDSAEYLIITSTGKRIESKGWAAFVNKNEKADKKISIQPVLSGAEKPWDAKYELDINFEFNAIAGNGHRPFAAIWVEDANKVSVRNLALWYNKPKWIPDLRNWYRINGDSFKADKNNYASVTGATRNPGKYTIKWDGKNDKGEFVPQGKYTIVIETSKEHGTDEILRQEMEFKKSAKKTNATGNVEISNVTFDFHKK